jgi:hypothetical protein
LHVEGWAFASSSLTLAAQSANAFVKQKQTTSTLQESHRGFAFYTCHAVMFGEGGRKFLSSIETRSLPTLTHPKAFGALPSISENPFLGSRVLD